ncbi:hypothetical protein [uncultured Eubacterium sp.]|uniref:hypothetical protein n=1 Tax=uncultured Eubacterium sp. TaxID=165185 RepID=UPI00205EAAE5|nr:hypothetical protein [uncultured Eubacterium sp.]DAX08152.1 MAG TPA: Ribbon-helix-helix protein, copG family [Inoviridae sp.]
MDSNIMKVLFYSIILILYFLNIYFIVKRSRKKQGIENFNPKFHELIQVIVPKGSRQQLKAYALIKGYRNEGELISHLINEELRKDNEKMNKKEVSPHPPQR